MKQGLWQSISEIFTKCDGQKTKRDQTMLAKAEREWYSAIASLEELLIEITDTTTPQATQGLILSAPCPILSDPKLLSCYQTGIFTSDSFKSLMPFQLPSANPHEEKAALSSVFEYSISPDDPLAEEQLCLILTAHFSMIIVLGKDEVDQTLFQFSFDPQAIQKAWGRLKSRLILSHPTHLKQLNQLFAEFAPQPPDYRLVTRFSHLLLKNLPNIPETVTQKSPKPKTEVNQTQSPEVELLKAFTHEIRTPLTTIRMMARSLLKRKDISPSVMKRLEVIDQECTEQINRMELIFCAAELKTTPTNQHQSLTSVSLEELLQKSIPCWKKQAQRRNVELDIILPEKLPTVVSNPAMLNQVLTGLMEKFTRSLPTGGQIHIQVTTAGNQLKLQVLSQCPHDHHAYPFCFNSNSPNAKSIGQLLTFQPETGSISLNLDITKNIFQALGGKLIVRQRPEAGEILTIFLPLDASTAKDWQNVEYQV